MGIEDRDWYREEHARKNGMRYNTKNATYSAARPWARSVSTTPHKHSRFSVLEKKRAENRKAWGFNFFKLAVFLLLVVVLRLLLKR